MTDTSIIDTTSIGETAAPATTVQRGRILRDAAAGPGLISCDGQQTPFTLEKHWRSDVPPTVGMIVEAMFDDAGGLQTIRAVSDADLAKEELRRLAGESQRKAKAATSAAYGAGAPMVRGLVTRIGTPSLIAMAGVTLGFLYLKAGTVSPSENSVLSLSPTLYDLTKLTGSANSMMQNLITGSMNLMSWICIAAVLAPLLPYIRPSSRASWLGYCAPLGFLLLLPLIFIMGLPSGTLHQLTMSDEQHDQLVEQAGSAHTADFVASLTAQFLQQLQVGIGAGLVVGTIAALFLAGKGLFRFLAFR